MFQTHWLKIVGIILGCVSGLVYVIQLAVLAEKKATRADAAQNDSGKGTPPSA
jgi:hypothetical protein